METATMYTQAESKINGRSVWHFLIDTPIGQIHVVDYEAEDMHIERTIINGDNEKAERKYKAICKKLIER